jgi:hypothetical protein
MRRWSAAAVALLVLVAACGQGQGEAEQPAQDLRVEASLDRARGIGARRVLVRLDNQGDAPVQIAQLQLVTARFAPLAPAERDTELPPGRALVMPAEYGEARCGGTPVDEPAVVVKVRAGDGELSEQSLPLPRPDPLLEELHGKECGQLAIAEAVDIHFAPGWTAAGDAIQGTLVLERRDADPRPIALVGTRGNVLYRLDTVADPPVPLARLDPGTPRVEIPVTIGMARCDVHAMIEAKNRYQFPIWVSVDDAPEQYLTVEVRDQGHRLLDDLLHGCLGT